MKKIALKTASMLAGLLGNTFSLTVKASDPYIPISNIGDLDKIDVSGLKTSLPTYIAAHGSHSSHASHSSHRSSSGGSYVPTPSVQPTSPSNSSSSSAPVNQPLNQAPQKPIIELSDGKKTVNLEDSLTNADKRKNLVMRVQLTLKALDFYGGGIDGVMGPGTRASVNKFRSSRGFPQQDKLDVNTLTALGITAY